MQLQFPTRQTFLRIGRIVLGVVCVVLGIAGLFLPFVQGILLLAIGGSLLSRESTVARHAMERLRRYLPRKLALKLGEHADGR